MKTKLLFPFGILAALSGPAMADTTPEAAQLDPCELSGSFDALNADCKAIQMAFQTEVGTCMAGLRADAAARAGRASISNSHSSRAQYLTCAATVRAKMGGVTD